LIINPLEEVNNILSELTIVDLLEKSAIENESNIALILNDKTFTYKELNARSNKIANFLVNKGVKPETLVPICLNSGLELITGIMGIIKAGGAYVPIDPDYPEYRINYILNDCGGSFVITTKAFSSKLAKLSAAEIIELDSDLISSSDASELNPNIDIKPTNLAYTMYTSGTTGVPNGVMIEHHSVVNNLNWAKNYFRIGVKDIILQKTNFCFDVSVWEIFWPLIVGAKLVIINKEDYKEIDRLKSTIELQKVSAIHFVPTMLELFLLSIAPGDCNSLKRVISSGEALTPFQVNLLKNKIPEAELFNLYGPTETTIHSSYWQIPGTIKVEGVPIGKPVDNTEILILNEQYEIQPEGNTGEIYIGGKGVARGYLNKKEFTASRFILNPFNSDKNDRLFKTGDLGRYLNDGNIEYLGRIDDQVKINGYRVELESVEANIKNSGIVNHAVVLTKKNALGATQITAYVILKPSTSIQDLWDYLVSKLPAYMLPTSIKEVKNIPFTHNGKVDKALLLKDGVNKQVKNITPRTELESTIMAIWSAVFGTGEISINDNFFEIGGNSIMAVKMLSLLKKETGKHVSFLLLYQFPTVESLAKLVDKQNAFKTPEVLVAIRPHGNKPPVYLVNGGGVVAEGFINLGHVLDEEQPVYSFQSNGYDSNGRLLSNIEDIASYYVKSILSNDEAGPYSIAGYSLGGIIAFEIARQLKAMGKEVRLLIMIDGLTRDPEIIKTKHSALSILRLIGLNIYLLRYGFSSALKYSWGIMSAVYRNIKTTYTRAPKTVLETQEPDKDHNFDVFSLHILAYKKYNLQAYDGNIVVFRAKRITFYTDDFKYLGWRPYAKKVKSISIKGHHYSIFDEVNIKGFGEKLQSVLDSGF
jgi:amino acid adenylation domain-containing protein